MCHASPERTGTKIRTPWHLLYQVERIDCLHRKKPKYVGACRHYVGIKLGSERKYRILAEAQRKGHPIEFDVLYYAESNRKRDILNEIGEKEGEYIRAYRPILNTQIPKEEDWHKWEANAVDARTVLKLFLDDERM